MPRKSLSNILLVSLAIALVLAATQLLVVTVDMLLLMFAGVLFGIFLNAPSRWIAELTGMSYRWANLLVVATLVGVAIAGAYYLGSHVVEKVATLESELQEALRNFSDRLEQSGWAQQVVGKDWQASDMVSLSSMSRVMQGVQGMLWGLTSLAVIFFVGVYVAFEPHLYRDGIIKLAAPQRRERMGEVLEQMHAVLGFWIIGRLISMTIIGVLTAVGLWVLDVPLPISLGVVAALLTFVPNIGPVVAAVPQALLALDVGPTTVAYVIALNLGLQMVESYLITPMVQRYEVSLPPALIISVQLLLGVLVGVIGVVMAAPLAATVLTAVQMLYIHDRLGDPDPGSFAPQSSS